MNCTAQQHVYKFHQTVLFNLVYLSLICISSCVWSSGWLITDASISGSGCKPKAFHFTARLDDQFMRLNSQQSDKLQHKDKMYRLMLKYLDRNLYRMQINTFARFLVWNHFKVLPDTQIMQMFLRWISEMRFIAITREQCYSFCLPSCESSVSTHRAIWLTPTFQR